MWASLSSGEPAPHNDVGRGGLSDRIDAPEGGQRSYLRKLPAGRAQRDGVATRRVAQRGAGRTGAAAPGGRPARASIRSTIAPPTSRGSPWAGTWWTERFALVLASRTTAPDASPSDGTRRSTPATSRPGTARATATATPASQRGRASGRAGA